MSETSLEGAVVHNAIAGQTSQMSDAPLSVLIVIHIKLDPISYFMHNNLPNNANAYATASPVERDRTDFA